MSKGQELEDDAIIPRSEIPLLGPYLPPRTVTERKLAEIWRNALGIDQVGIRDNYNDLGRDSMLAAGIFVEIEEAFGLVMPIACLVDNPTIEQLAHKIDALLSKAGK